MSRCFRVMNRNTQIISVILLFYIFFHQLMSYSSASEDPIAKYPMLKNKLVDNVGIMKKFFHHLRTIYLANLLFRVVFFIGGSPDNLREAKSFFDICPIVLCRDANSCPHGKRFSKESMIVIFLDDLNKKILSKNKYEKKFFNNCRWCSILYITEETTDLMNQIPPTFDTAIKRKLQRVIFAAINDHEAKIYGQFVAINCSMELRPVGVWTPGNMFNIFDDNSFTNDFNGCPITVSTFKFPPKMLLKNRDDDDDGTEIVVGGSEGNLLLTLAKHLNLTIIIRSPDNFELAKNSGRSSIIMDVASGKSDIAIGGLRAKVYTENLYGSVAYDSECMVWTVPLKKNWARSIPWRGFSWQVWSLVGLVNVIVCLFAFFHNRINLLRKKIGSNVEFSAIILDVVALHLGNSIKNVPRLTRGRIILTLTLWYALILTTAFRTSLASILMTDTDSQVITDSEGILRENLNIGGTAYSLAFLKDQMNESETASKLVERFVILNNPVEIMRRRSSGGKFAIISRLSSIGYDIEKAMKSGESIRYSVLDDCVLKYYSVIIFRDDSQLRQSMNNVIMRLQNSGIVHQWASTETIYYKKFKYELDNNGICFGGCVRQKFKEIFLFYFICVSLSLLTFLTEILIKNRITCSQLKSIISRLKNQ